MPAYGERFVIPALEKLRGQYNNMDFDVNLTPHSLDPHSLLTIESRFHC